MKKFNKMQFLHLAYLVFVAIAILSFGNLNTAESIKNVCLYSVLAGLVSFIANRVSKAENKRRSRSRKIRRHRQYYNERV